MTQSNGALTALTPSTKSSWRRCLESILNRPDHPDVGWTPPPQADIDRNRAETETMLSELQGKLIPAPETFIRERLTLAAHAVPSRDVSRLAWKVRFDEYLRLLDGYPADMWQTALDLHVCESQWFPTVSELQSIMAPMLAERRQQVTRLEAMLGQGAGARPWEALGHARLVAAVAVRRAERGTSIRLGGITESERQAADAYIDATERGEVEDNKGLAAPHAIDVWRRNEQRIEAQVGDKVWKFWISMLTPHKDDGTTLTLAAPSRLIAAIVERDHAQLIGKIVGRKIAVEVHPYAGPAAHQRQRRAGTEPPQATSHVKHQRQRRAGTEPP